MKVPVRAIVCGLIVLCVMGCRRGGDAVSSGGNGPARDTRPVDGTNPSPVSSASSSQGEVHAAEETICSLIEELRGDFTKSRASGLAFEALRVLQTLTSRDARVRVFVSCNDRLCELMTAKLASIERFGEPGGPSLEMAANDLNVMCQLVESFWRLGADPRVQYPVSINEYELCRIKYARREAARWRQDGVEELARLHDSVADRLGAVVDDPDGPSRKGFDLICRRVDARADGRRMDGRSRYDIKAGVLDKIGKSLGRDPGWAEEWREKNTPPGQKVNAD